jgi:hypothetical protein
MARAGYDPRDAVSPWERMNKIRGVRPAEILSTHPAPESRIENLRGIHPEALRYYKGGKEAGNGFQEWLEILIRDRFPTRRVGNLGEEEFRECKKKRPCEEFEAPSVSFQNYLWFCQKTYASSAPPIMI